jgi:hypothetical protein
MIGDFWNAIDSLLKLKQFISLLKFNYVLFEMRGGFICEGNIEWFLNISKFLGIDINYALSKRV